MSSHELVQTWRPRLVQLADELRRVTLEGIVQARESGTQDALARPVGEGAGDITYGLDEPAERALDAWREAQEDPLSLLTEESGWRHAGAGDPSATNPSATNGASRDPFAHSGPRIVVDPIDGTRNLMTDLRSAWSVIALAAPGSGQPRLSDVVLGVVSEIPDSRAASYRTLVAERGGACRFEQRRIDDGTLIRASALHTGHDARVDHGYFPFFKYMADQRPLIASTEAAFFQRLARHEQADVRNCYDDQYISNGGQLALLAQGTYRMIADLRAFLAATSGRPTITTKPYDIAGAVLCAQAAGAVIETPEGGPLDFPLDVETPVSWVGWANAETRERLAPHLWAILSRLA